MNLSNYVRNMPVINRSNKICVAAYEPSTTYTHFIFKVDKSKKECIILTTPTLNTMGRCELTLAFIDELDNIILDATVIDSPYIGMDYKDVIKQLE